MTDELIWAGDEAIFTIARRLASPNQAYWASWIVKHREAKAWRDAIRQALTLWLIEKASTRVQRVAIAPILIGGTLPAPLAVYRVEVCRYVQRPSHLITDDDNLAFSVKPVLDALVRTGVIFSDTRVFLERVTPMQAVVGKGEPVRTTIRVRPFWHPYALLFPELQKPESLR